MSIPLVHARICQDEACSLVFDTRQHRTCPGCGFSLHVPLSRWLNRRRTPDELAVQRLRQTWARGRRV